MFRYFGNPVGGMVASEIRGLNVIPSCVFNQHIAKQLKGGSNENSANMESNS